MIIYVIFTHISLLGSKNPEYVIILSNGNFAVSFFFLLSGFLYRRKYNQSSFNYRNDVTSYLKPRRNLFIKYILMILISTLYCFYLYFFAHRYSISEILLSSGLDILTLSTLIYPSSLTMNAGWFFQSLLHFWLLAPLLNKCLNNIFSKKDTYLLKIVFLLVIYFGTIKLYSLTGRDPYYFSLIRVFEVFIGMTIYDLSITIKPSKRISTILETIGLFILICPVLVYVFFKVKMSNLFINTLINYLLVLFFAFNNGSISNIFKESKIVRYLSNHVFDIFIFHFVIIKCLSSTAMISSPIVYALLSIIFSIIIGTIIDKLFPNQQ